MTRTLALVDLCWVGVCWVILGLGYLLRFELPATLTIIEFSRFRGGREFTIGTEQFFANSAIVLGVAALVVLVLVLVGWRSTVVTFIASIYFCAVLPSGAGVLVVTLAWQLGMSTPPDTVPLGIWVLGLVGFTLGLTAGFTSAYLFCDRVARRERADPREDPPGKGRR